MGGAGPDWPRPVVHWAIEAVDPERQRAFYATMFGWDVGEGPFMMIPAGFGSPEPGPGGHIQAGERSRIGLWVQVRDLAESIARCVELGGTSLSDPFDVPGGPTIAPCEDPEGNPLVLVQQ